MLPMFIFDTHMDKHIYSSFYAHTLQRRAVLKGAKLSFIGDYCFGYPTIIRTNDKKDRVYGLLVQFAYAKDFEKFEFAIKGTRSHWKCEKKKVVVVDDQGNDVNAIIYVMFPYAKDRGTRPGRLEVPLKECYKTMCKCYKDNGFKKKFLVKALSEMLNEYYEEKIVVGDDNNGKC